jgi:hypothetical protein
MITVTHRPSTTFLEHEILWGATSELDAYQVRRILFCTYMHSLIFLIRKYIAEQLCPFGQANNMPGTLSEGFYCTSRIFYRELVPSAICSVTDLELACGASKDGTLNTFLSRSQKNNLNLIELHNVHKPGVSGSSVVGRASSMYCIYRNASTMHFQ